MTGEARKAQCFRLGQFLDFLAEFLDLFLYGSWEAPHSSKILPRGTPTFSTPGEAIPRLFEKSIFPPPRGHFPLPHRQHALSPVKGMLSPQACLYFAEPSLY